MINWFGPESWGAPICDETPRCDIPVGEPCGYCDKKLTEKSRGVSVPFVDVDFEQVGAKRIYYHLRCFLGSILTVPHAVEDDD